VSQVHPRHHSRKARRQAHQYIQSQLATKLWRARTWCHPRGELVHWWSVSSGRRQSECRRSPTLVSARVVEQRRRPKTNHLLEKRPAFRLEVRAQQEEHRKTQGRRHRVCCPNPRNLSEVWGRNPRPCVSRREALPAVLEGRQGWTAGRDCSTTSLAQNVGRKGGQAYPALISERIWAWAGSS